MKWKCKWLKTSLIALILCCLMQEKEIMEAAVRAFEDWEFRVLEQESGIEEDDQSVMDKDNGGENEREMEREISCQQHVVNTAQVNMS